MEHSNYIRTHRRKWALTQQDVADLLGLRARSVIAAYENGASTPRLQTVLTLQFAFGAAIQELYAIAEREIEDEIMRRAAELDRAYASRTDATARRVREFLTDLISRASNTDGV